MPTLYLYIYKKNIGYIIVIYPIAMLNFLNNKNGVFIPHFEYILSLSITVIYSYIAIFTWIRRC